MGLAILPGRLKIEFKELAEALVQNKDISGDEKLGKHADWMNELKEKYGSFTDNCTCHCFCFKFYYFEFLSPNRY